MSSKRTSGGSKLRRQLRQLDPILRSEIKAAMTTAAQDLATEIAARAPKDDGNLARAVHYKVSSDGLGANIGYSNKKSGFKMKYKRGGFAALFQEFGTKHHGAQPFIRPSFRAKLKHNLDLIDAAVLRSIKRIVNTP